VVLETAKDADLWLSPSYYSSFKQLEDANALYTNFEAFKTKNIYSFTNTTGKTGGVLYYELGTARPDLVLKDIIKVCHPELLEGYKPYFFKPLQ
jgi:iron complex transport system substrate-binding protein